MVTEKIVLENPKRFSKPHSIPKSKLESAAQLACDRLANMAKAHYGQFPHTYSTDFLYQPWGRNDNWVTGLYTG